LTEDFDGTEARGGWPYGRKGSPGDYHRRKGEPARPVRRVSAHQRLPMYHVATVDGDEQVDLFRDKDGRLQVHTRDAVYDLDDVVGGRVVINIGTLGALNVLAKAGYLPRTARREVGKAVKALRSGSALSKDEQSYSSLVTAPVGAQDQGLRVLEEPEPPRSRSTRRPPAVPTGGDAQAEQPLYILRTGNNPLGKQGFTHQHDEWPRHPIRVEDHQAYFSEHADGQDPEPEGAEQDTGAGQGTPESDRGAAADAPGAVVFGGEADLGETCESVFGRTPGEGEWSAIVGVPPDADVNVSTHGDEAIVRARWGHNSVVVVSYRADKTAELNFIVTAGEEKGTGADVVRRIMRTAAELGFRRLELISIPKAKRFWEGMGFEAVEGEDFEMAFDLAGYVGKRSGGRGGRTYLGPDEQAPEGVEVRRGKHLEALGRVEKQGFTHEHDGWPRHPIGVKYHAKYFAGKQEGEDGPPEGGDPEARVNQLIEDIAAERFDTGFVRRGKLPGLDDQTLKDLWMQLDLDIRTGRVKFTLYVRKIRDGLHDEVMRRGLLPGMLSAEFYRSMSAVTDGRNWGLDKREQQKASLASSLGKAAFGGPSKLDTAIAAVEKEAVESGAVERVDDGGNVWYKSPDGTLDGRWGLVRWILESRQHDAVRGLWADDLDRAIEGDETYGLLFDIMKLDGTSRGIRWDLGGMAFWLGSLRVTNRARTLSEAAASLLIASWAKSASDHVPLSIAVQKAAAAEFGMATNIDEWSGEAAAGEANAFLAAHGDQVKVLVRTVYSRTQGFLKKRGVEELTVARGWGWEPRETPEWFVDMVRESRHDAYWNGEPPARPVAVRKTVGLNPMSSFSTEYEGAQAFAGSRNGLVTMARVPAARVLSTFMTGFGCATENEVILLGGELDAVHVAGSSEALPKGPDEAADVLEEGGLRIGDAQEWPRQSPLFNAAEGPQAVPLDAEAYDWPKRTRDYDLHQGDANDNIAGLDKHLPGGHDQEDHGNRHRLSDAHPPLGEMTVGHGGDKRAATAKDWEKYEGEAKARVEEWVDGGKYGRKMEPEEICYEGYRLRASARNASDSWCWALWEAVQRFAASRGFSYKDDVTEEDVFADPAMPEPEGIIGDDKVRERWQVAAHTADSWLTDYRNSNNAKALLDFFGTESGGMWRRHCQRDLWNLARGSGGETVSVGKRGFGAERHFDDYRPFAEPGGLKGANTWEEALDAEFTVYRGVVKGDEAENARRKPVVSYTTSPEIARLFAEGYYHSYNVPGQGKVYQRTCRLRDVLSYLNPDGELEVLLRPPGSKAEKAYGGYDTNSGIAFTHEHDGLPRHSAVLKDHAALDKRSGGRGGKIFLGPGEDAPEGVEVHEGPRGGRWYQGGKAKKPEPKKSTTSRRVLEGKTPEEGEIEGETTFAQAGLRGGIWGAQTAIAECKPGVLPHADGLSDTRLLHKMVPQDAVTEFTVFKVFEALRPGFCPPVMLDVEEDTDLVGRPAGHSMRWVDDAGFGGTAMTMHEWLGPDKPLGSKALNEAQAADAGFMNTVDWLVYNQDRHTGNVIVDGDRLWPIDHGVCSVGELPYEYRVDYTFRGSLQKPEVLKAFRDSALAALKKIAANADKVAIIMSSKGGTKPDHEDVGWARSIRAAAGIAAQTLDKWYKAELRTRKEQGARR
jgi:hypothetical protein